MFDLVAIKTSPFFCANYFQVKTGKWPYGGELKELIRVAKSASGLGNVARIVVVRFNKQSSVVDWVDMEDLVGLKKPYPWLDYSCEVDLRE